MEPCVLYSQIKQLKSPCFMDRNNWKLVAHACVTAEVELCSNALTLVWAAGMDLPITYNFFLFDKKLTHLLNVALNNTETTAGKPYWGVKKVPVSVLLPLTGVLQSLTGLRFPADTVVASVRADLTSYEDQRFIKEVLGLVKRKGSPEAVVSNCCRILLNVMHRIPIAYQKQIGKAMVKEISTPRFAVLANAIGCFTSMIGTAAVNDSQIKEVLNIILDKWLDQKNDAFVAIHEKMILFGCSLIQLSQSHAFLKPAFLADGQLTTLAFIALRTVRQYEQGTDQERGVKFSLLTHSLGFLSAVGTVPECLTVLANTKLNLIDSVLGLLRASVGNMKTQLTAEHLLNLRMSCIHLLGVVSEAGHRPQPGVMGSIRVKLGKHTIDYVLQLVQSRVKHDHERATFANYLLRICYNESSNQVLLLRSPHFRDGLKAMFDCSDPRTKLTVAGTLQVLFKNVYSNPNPIDIQNAAKSLFNTFTKNMGMYSFLISCPVPPHVRLLLIIGCVIDCCLILFPLHLFHLLLSLLSDPFRSTPAPPLRNIYSSHPRNSQNQQQLNSVRYPLPISFFTLLVFVL